MNQFSKLKNLDFFIEKNSEELFHFFAGHPVINFIFTSHDFEHLYVRLFH